MIDSELTMEEELLTKSDIRKFISERPMVTERGLSLEAGLSESYVNTLLKDDSRNVTENTARKLLPIMLKYGWVK
jgi:hypothetical protein